jgi:hypothetical protein
LATASSNLQVNLFQNSLFAHLMMWLNEVFPFQIKRSTFFWW